jgi:hypothetical protein
LEKKVPVKWASKRGVEGDRPFYQIAGPPEVPLAEPSSAQGTVAQSKELEAYIAALLAKKREMDSALQDFVAARAATSSASGPSSATGATQGKVERAGSAFDRVLGRQTGITGATSPHSSCHVADPRAVFAPTFCVS